MPSPQLDPDVGAILPQLLEVLSGEYGERLCRIVLFGSRVKGSAGRDSDLDVAVLLSGTVEDSWEEELRLDERLRDLRPRVDLHLFGESEFHRQAPVPGTLAYPISREGATVYGRQRRSCPLPPTLDLTYPFQMDLHRSDVMPQTPIVHSHPGILGGTPVFVGTRVPVQALLDYLEEGDTLDAFLDAFPSVTREQAVAFLKQAAEALLARSPRAA